MWHAIRSFYTRFSSAQSVRGRVSTAMGVAGIVLGILLTAVMHWRWEDSVRSAAQTRLQLTAQRAADALLENLGNRQLQIQQLADVISLSPQPEPASIRRLFDQLQQRQADYAWIGLVDADGLVQVSSRGLLENRNVAQRYWFQAGLRGPFFGEPHEAVLLAKHFPARADGEPLRFIDVAVPIRNASNQLTGVLGAHLYWDWAKSIVHSVNETEEIEVLLADQKGNWIMKPLAEPSHNLAQMAAQQDPERYLSAQTTLHFQHSIEQVRWTVVVREQAQHVLAPIKYTRNLMLLLVITGAAIFALVSWSIAGRVVRPIVALAELARMYPVSGSETPAKPEQNQRDEVGMMGQVMHQLAYFDLLTGLANRRRAREYLNTALQKQAQHAQFGAIVLIDLDHFSHLNDTLGDEAGDQLLIEITRRMQGIAVPCDMLARLGSDEFVALFSAPHKEQARQLAADWAQQALTRIKQLVDLGGKLYHCHASVGISLFGERSITANEVFKQAEVAMFDAKNSHHSKIVFFDEAMQASLDERVLMERLLRQAMPGEMYLLYQPQIDQNGHILGAELLARWQQPQLGMISPARFIPLAEETGLIIVIGHWALEEACKQLRRWASEPETAHLVLAVNVSAQEFVLPDYVERVVSVLEKSGANPRRLKLELTESILASDVEQVTSNMQMLRNYGVSFALDDFGTGFSSLSYLKNMPFDQLKIDQSFVCDMTVNPSDAAIVKAIVALGHSLNLDVIAEGVETEAQQQFLLENHCYRFQGYLFGKPMLMAEFEQACRLDWQSRSPQDLPLGVNIRQ
ncbi:bifunctional diguanylate cyclase/phosphodiesterase [Chitinibacter sp. GC72]|uniref:putative bifunctional diguanylate cyclase/phosphodiesterase n=1 Tax=Chitinibacter sp. GC72 TaxID=1526917 RepID=UPI0012FB75F8|nr:EAL domain-containing protein [Chitinibacter sp. GC72]